MMYQSVHFQSATPLALSVLADTVLNPAFLPEEIESQRDATRYEIREIRAKPELILPEILHEVAYGGKGLGNPILCPEERIDLINVDTLRDFMAKWYRPDRIVIAGAGMPHEELVELVDKHFSSLKGETAPTLPLQPLQHQHTPSRQNLPPSHLLQNSSSPSLLKSFTRAASYLYPQSVSPVSGQIPPLPPSDYTGGHSFIHDAQGEFNHVYLAWEGPGIQSPDIYALATMQMLLGGGGSFSAGGPGKGMYSRLYTHILNHHPQIDHCEAYHHIYTDSSLIGLFASFLPASASPQLRTPAQIIPYLVHQISLLLHVPVGEAELSKAKNQLKSSLVMALESRAVEVEDLGRQVTTFPFTSCEGHSFANAIFCSYLRFRPSMTDRSSVTRFWCTIAKFPCPKCVIASMKLRRRIYGESPTASLDQMSQSQPLSSRWGERTWVIGEVC